MRFAKLRQKKTGKDALNNAGLNGREKNKLKFIVKKIFN